MAGSMHSGVDINIVMHKGERSRDHFSVRCTKEFKKWLKDLVFLDLPLVGGRWTWSNMRIQPCLLKN